MNLHNGEMRQKKNLHILYSGLGGHGNVFFSMVKGDKGKAFLTEALFCGIEDVQPDYLTRCADMNIPAFFLKKKSGLDFPTLKKIYKRLKKSKPDTVFLHGPTLILPVIFYVLFSRRQIIVRDTQPHHLKTRNEWIFLALACLFARHVVFLTKEAEEGAKKKLKWKGFFRHAVVIPNGLDTDLYKPVPLRSLSSTIIIGMQSRLQRIKDHPTLLKAFALLRARLPEKEMELHIAGDGETMQELKRLAEELAIAGSVNFTGMLSETRLLSFLQSLDIYVHATHGETMSNSIMQAMACGLPSVVSDVWGVNNMVSHEKNSLLYEPGNAVSLATQTERIIADDTLRRQLAAAARQYAEDELSVERLFQRYRPLLEGGTQSRKK